jgi:hypothetical protein
MIFKRKPRLVEGLANDREVPFDPNWQVVDEIRASFPYGAEQFGLKSMIRLTVHTVLEMKKRGLI